MYVPDLPHLGSVWQSLEVEDLAHLLFTLSVLTLGHEEDLLLYQMLLWWLRVPSTHPWVHRLLGAPFSGALLLSLPQKLVSGS